MSFKRRVLSALGKAELLSIGRRLDLNVTTRMSLDELCDVLAGSKRANLTEIVNETMSRDTLKAICEATGLDDRGKEKRPLVDRILAAANGSSNDIAEPSRVDSSRTTKRKRRTTDRRRAGIRDSEAVVSGSLKAALRQFALGAAGGYSGRVAHVSFTTHLLESFGWTDGRPDGAEIPCEFAIADAGQRVEREVALWWRERRVMLEVAPHDAVLAVAWKDLVRVCLQLDPPPQYVVLTNQRDLQLYDLARDREAPRLSIAIDDLPKYSEAFPFFQTDWKPGMTPKIVNVEKVSTEVADLVAKLFRSVRAQHGGQEKDVIRFTLQCITAMFAEDIGLLPKNYFTTLLYDGARHRDVERRLRELFVLMNTPNLPLPRVVPYFNGGLFTEANSLPLGSEQLVALTKAAEADWTYVDPHIFGSVFQGILDEAERHSSGAHYTAHDDIMRVVGPTIVEPWRRRIQAAGSLKELTELRAALFRYRVLDPACGSGNFLYVAFRELYKIDTEVLSRMREFTSTHGKLSWNGGIPTTNFYGIDTNEFAVELAKVTLNIAKKIAYEERKAQVLALAGQVEMDVDPSLPLDNLDNNIICDDALFRPWPKVDAIVSNPPYLGGLKIRSEKGADYLEKLQERYPGVNGRADFCSFWFRRAHDDLPPGGRAGLVATNTVREGNTREATLDYVVGNGGTIVNAVSSQPWPGIAVVNVSMVNWVKGAAEDEPRRLTIDGTVYEPSEISPALQLELDLGSAAVLVTEKVVRCSVGIQHGTKEFEIDRATAEALLRDKRARQFIRPVASASDLLRGTACSAPDYVIDMSACESEPDARGGGAAYDHLRKHVLPFVRDRAENATTGHYKNWLRTWWRPMWPRLEFFANARKLTRIVACSAHAARPIFFLLSRKFFPTNSLQLFAFDDDYSFGVLQSRFHWRWAVGRGTKIKEDIRYSGDVWDTFPWPQEPSEDQAAAVAESGRTLRAVRDQLMLENDWSLRDLYQSADVAGSHRLNDAQAALDSAVADAYGIPPDQDMPEFLLELNRLLAEDLAAHRTVTGPGLPKHLNPEDRRWRSEDCIEPPPISH